MARRQLVPERFCSMTSQETQRERHSKQQCYITKKGSPVKLVHKDFHLGVGVKAFWVYITIWHASAIYPRPGFSHLF